MLNYAAHLLAFFAFYAALAVSLDLSLGYGGIFNIAHAAFCGVGGYAGALVALHWGAPYPFTLAIGGVCAAAVAMVLSLSVLRLRGDYLALATLAFCIIVEDLLRNWTLVTGGARGLTGIPPAAILRWEITGPVGGAFVLVGILAVTLLFFSRFERRALRLVIEATRDDEIAARAVGINVLAVRCLVLGVSGFFAGLAGAQYAHYLGTLDPSRFTISESFLLISMVVLGGAGRLWGALVGALVYSAVPELLRLLPIASAEVAAARQVLFSLTLVVMLICRPQGILGREVFRAGRTGSQ